MILEQTLIRMFDNINSNIETVKRGVSYKFISGIQEVEEKKYFTVTVSVTDAAAGYKERELQEIRRPVKESSQGMAEVRATAYQMLYQAIVETSLIHWHTLSNALGGDKMFQKKAKESLNG
jgi:septation ring formation regulator EzrA